MNHLIIQLCATLMIITALSTPVYATSSTAPAHFSIVRGDVSLQKAAEKGFIPAAVGLETFFGDVVQTQSRSRAQLIFLDGSKVNLSSNYNIEIKEFAYDADRKLRKSVIRSMRGTLRAIVSKVEGDQSSFEIETPSAVAAVRGTDFFTVILPNGVTEVIVLEGAVAVRNINSAIKGEVLVKAFQMTRVKKGEAPIPPRHVELESLQALKYLSDPRAKKLETKGNTETAPVVAPLGSFESSVTSNDLVMVMSSPETKKKENEGEKPNDKPDLHPMQATVEQPESSIRNQGPSVPPIFGVPLSLSGNFGTTPLGAIQLPPLSGLGTMNGPTSNITFQLLFP